MDDLYTSIGRRVRKLRRQKGWTQEKLAEAAEISLSFLGHIEHGTRKMSVATLFKLSQALACATDDLLGTGMESRVDPATLLSFVMERLQAGETK